MKEQGIQKLGAVAKNEGQYYNLLVNLIAQSLYRLIESEVFIKCREKDLNLVNRAVEQAVTMFKNEIKQDVKVRVLNQYLSPDM